MRLVNPRNSTAVPPPADQDCLESAIEGSCPDENALAEYLDGLLHDGQTKGELEGHLVVCPRCHYLVQLLSAEEPPLSRVG